MRGRIRLGDVDWIMLGTAVTLAVIGIFVIRSASGASASGSYATRQAYWLVMAVAAYFLGYFVDRRHLRRSAYVLYAGVWMILVALAVAGKVAGGVQRWIHFGGLTFQPSEIAKITLILALARYFHRKRGLPPYGLRDILIPLIIVAAYVVPVALQPDLGTAMFLVLMSAPVFLTVGVRIKAIIPLAAAAAVSAPSLFFSLKEYQRERILNFLTPGRDPLGTGYHVVQSKIAIGSGGLMGKGYLEGTQSQLRFIPEQHTDFIISVLAEEFGFIGIAVVFGGLVFLTLWMLSYFDLARNRFDLLAIVGISCMFAVQAAINLAMTVGILPVVGLPLPLLSYGGSSLVSTFLGLGIIAGYRRRRG